MTIEKSDQLF